MGRKRLSGHDLPERVYKYRDSYYYAPKNAAERHRKQLVFLCREKKDVEATLNSMRRNPAEKLLVRLLSSSRKRAKNKSIEHTLELDDLCSMFDSTGGRCSVSGIRFDTSRAKPDKFRNPYRPSLDRIDCSRGYTVNNCRLVCVVVNIGLNEFGEDVFYKVAKGVVRKRKAA